MLTTHEPTGCNTLYTLQSIDAKGQNKNTPIILNESTMRARSDFVDSNGSVLIVSRLVQCVHTVLMTPPPLARPAPLHLKSLILMHQVIRMCCVSPVPQPRISVFTNLPCSSLSRSFPLSPRSHLRNSFIQLAHNM